MLRLYLAALAVEKVHPMPSLNSSCHGEHQEVDQNIFQSLSPVMHWPLGSIRLPCLKHDIRASSRPEDVICWRVMTLLILLASLSHFCAEDVWVSTPEHQISQHQYRETLTDSSASASRNDSRRRLYKPGANDFAQNAFHRVYLRIQ